MGRIAGTGVVVVGAGIGGLAGEFFGGLADKRRCLVDRGCDVEGLLDAIIPMYDDGLERICVFHDACFQLGAVPIDRRSVYLTVHGQKRTFVLARLR